MKLLARIVGVLLVLFGLMGLAATSLARGMQTTTPVWGDLEWTGTVRALADWVIYAAFLPAGLFLAWRGPARFALGLALVLAAVRWGFDFKTADLSTSRGEVILHGDMIATVVAAVGLAVGVVTARAGRDQKG